MKKRAQVLGISIAALALGAHAAQAGVKDSDKTGFTISQSLEIAAPPAKVYQALVGIGGWWNPSHSYSGKAENMHLDARAGGCWCETLPDGSVSHMTVAFIKKDTSLRMTGGLGPLQTMADGAVSIDLARKDAGTTLTMTYRVWGYDPAGLNAIASAVDGVWAEQLGRLKSLIETGKPVK